MSDELKIAIEAAKIGAQEALKFYKDELEVKIKEDNTVVTIADKASEEKIKSYITSKYHNAKFVAEESGGNRDDDSFWIIDPIDGTRSFTRGIPSWAILISFVKDNSVVVGVCYFPVLDTILYAEKGKGAYIDGKKVSVSKIKNLKNSYLGYGSPRHFKNKKLILDLIEYSGSARSFDATYSSFLLTEGKLDVHVDAYAEIWDAAPFKISVEEAGGKFTNLKGEKWRFTDRGYIATNGLLHEDVLKIVKSNQ